MKIGILGTGVVGQTIAAKLAEQGHEFSLAGMMPKLRLRLSECSARGSDGAQP